jgi:hypothetical protein
MWFPVEVVHSYSSYRHRSKTAFDLRFGALPYAIICIKYLAATLQVVTVADGNSKDATDGPVRPAFICARCGVQINVLEWFFVVSRFVRHLLYRGRHDRMLAKVAG